MEKECRDCYFAIMEASGRGDRSWFECKKRRKRISLDDPACADFLPDDQNTCEDCEYFEGGGYIWSTHGVCSLKGTKRANTDRACTSFLES